jgi:hypothetical protein
MLRFSQMTAATMANVKDNNSVVHDGEKYSVSVRLPPKQELLDFKRKFRLSDHPKTGQP